MKRFAAMLVVSVLMVLWIASGDRMSAGQRTDGLYYEVTGIHPDAVLMRINGEDISAEEYLYWLAYDCEYLTSYVPNLDFSAEVSNGMTYGSYAKADAVETVKLYALLRQWAKQYNVSLTEEDEARLQQQRQQYVTYYGGEEGYQQQLQLLGISEDTFETVVLLSKGEVESKKIRIEFSLEDMDMSEFQDGATYTQIKDYVLEHSGLKVSNLYISQIKRKCGIEVGKNYNLPKSEDSRQPMCPPEKEKAIREAFKYFGMI